MRIYKSNFSITHKFFSYAINIGEFTNQLYFFLEQVEMWLVKTKRKEKKIIYSQSLFIVPTQSDFQEDL